MNIAPIKDFILSKRYYVIAALLVIVLGIGAKVGYDKYTFAHSPENFTIELNAALATANTADLAKKIDFRNLTEHMAAQILAAKLPESIAPKEQDPVILAEKIQQAFLQAIANKDAPPPIVPPHIKPDPLAPYEPIPFDFIKQIAGKIMLHSQKEDQAFLRAMVNYPRLEKDIPFFFLMEKKEDWQVTSITNMQDLLRTYGAEERLLVTQRQEKFAKDKATNLERIRKQFELESCTAFLYQPSGQKFPVLTVRIGGYNKGPFIIRNITFKTTVTANTPEGPVTFNKNIATSSRLNPGINMEDSYTLELDGENPEHAAIIAAKEISCTAVPNFMTLDNGEMLFTREEDIPKK